MDYGVEIMPVTPLSLQLLPFRLPFFFLLILGAGDWSGLSVL